jgi:hypothetical protein
MTSNRFIIFLTFILLIFTIYCDNPLGPALEELKTTNVYLPLNVGNKWIYNYNNSSEASIEVISYENVCGKNAAKLKFIINTSTFYKKYVNEKQGLLCYNINWQKELEYPLIIGQEWKFEELNYNYKCMVIERCDVTTDYGRIKDCVKIEIDKYKKSFKEEVYDGNITRWYKKDLGLVKMSQTFNYSPEDNYTITLKEVHK